MFNKIIKKNRKAQVGETVTWLIATVIIIVILFISIFVATSYLGDRKKANVVRQTDVLASKSFFSYLLTNDTDNGIVYGQLKNEGDFNEFSGELAESIFREFYKGEYFGGVWMGHVSIDTRRPFNDYFGSGDRIAGGRHIIIGSNKADSHISEIVKLNENKFIELLLMIRKAPTDRAI